MSQAVLMSIRPEWVDKIFFRGKGIEVRKSRPQLEPPFKVYVYQTLPKRGDRNERDGRVVGEFECMGISQYPYGTDEAAHEFEKLAMLDRKKLWEYGECKPLYGWVIWNRVVYDKPKKLSEFHSRCPKEYCQDTCPRFRDKSCNISAGRLYPVPRPPQSWMYVEEIE